MAETKQGETEMTRSYNRVNDNPEGSLKPLGEADVGFETFPGNPAGSKENGSRSANVDPFKLP